ncbi:MAG: hypothetical protein A2V85_02075 [Chloroflexi bacterium RBG_16_72_14]|nr:MAG: hypothetical protein A2V85_02075 [Chloroflexi bacterium RBG_16_72_14]
MDVLVPPAQGSCAGHLVHSDIPFRILRAGGDGSALAVRETRGAEPDGELLARWSPRPGNPFHGRLLRTGATFAFWASDAGWFLVDPAEPSITLSAGDGPLSLTAEVRLFGVPSTLIALEQGDVCLHAAAVEIGGRAVVLAGPSRHGKTTLAAAFAAAGHRLLTEDMTRCTMAAGPAVFPGPAVVRLRPDVVDGIRIPGASSVEVERERVFVMLDGPQRGTGSPVPLAAILFLRDGPGPGQLDPAPSVDAIRDLWSLAFTLPTDASRGAVFGRVADLAARVPVLDLRRELRLDTLPDVIGLVGRLVERLVLEGAQR